MAKNNNYISLAKYFENFPNASLRRLAAATNINYGVLLKKSKEPIVGEVYDPNATNWRAVEDKLTAKGIDWALLNWDELNVPIVYKETTLPKDMGMFPIGCKVYLRRDNTTPFEVVYKTETHVVIQQVGTSEPRAWSNSTFLLNGPTFEPRANLVVDECPTEVNVDPNATNGKEVDQ